MLKDVLARKDSALSRTPAAACRRAPDAVASLHRGYLILQALPPLLGLGDLYVHLFELLPGNLQVPLILFNLAAAPGDLPSEALTGRVKPLNGRLKPRLLVAQTFEYVLLTGHLRLDLVEPPLSAC